MDRRLKVLMINGSPRKNGNIALALSEMEGVFRECDVDFETVQIGRMDLETLEGALS